MRLLLLYAGMAADKVTEQIGAAVSDDGVTFRRVQDAPVVPIDSQRDWKAVRACNPSVVRTGDGYLMFYQGVAAETLHTAIGVARSDDALSWWTDDEPCLSWRDLAAFDSKQDDRFRVGAIEPTVLVEDGRLKMWFVYSHRSHEGNLLFYAESETGEAWDIRPEPVLSGAEFGFRRLHYPQVSRTDSGYELLFTLRSRRSEVDSIWRAVSQDGIEWRNAQRIMSTRDPKVVSRDDIAGKVAWRLLKPLVRTGGRDALGYSHPHVIDVDGRQLMYFHANHAGPRGRTLDIGLRDADGNVRTVFTPAADASAWDSYFVGDPFVLDLSS